LAVVGQTLLQQGRYGETQVWQPSTVHCFTRAWRDPDQGLGFWRRRLTALAAVDDDAQSYGHRGFTGCELVVDPSRQLLIVMLSNRLHSEADPPTDDASLWRDVVRAVVSSPAA
jgi:CubicO group peptidase (beta-lactamase class C family)